MLVFFVEKKNGKKRMLQDYQYLNEWIVKNNYPLPLISDIIKNIGYIICAGSRTWRKMEDDGVGDKELLVTRSYKEYWKICRQI